jgi:hypothetical protein
MSAVTPSGGDPGSALRNTGRAKQIAASAPIKVASARRTSANVRIPIASAQQPSASIAQYAHSANTAKAPLREIVVVS